MVNFKKSGPLKFRENLKIEDQTCNANVSYVCR